MNVTQHTELLLLGKEGKTKEELRERNSIKARRLGKKIEGKLTPSNKSLPPVAVRVANSYSAIEKPALL